MTEEAKKSNEDRIAHLNSKVEEISVHQEEELVADYDAALEEWQHEHKPYKVKFKGHTFEIPRSIPFNFSLFYMKNCVKKQQGKTIFTIPDDKQVEFIEKMFGKKFLELLEKADDVELDFVFSKLVPDIMHKWGYTIQGSQETKTKATGKNK